MLSGFAMPALSQNCEAPVVSDVTICRGSTAVLTATGEQGDFRWYDALSDGNLLFEGPAFATPALSASRTYYVEVVNESCLSPRTAVTVTVRPNPTASGLSTCAGSSVTLRATAPGGVYQWYDAPVNGNLLSVGADYNTGSVFTTTTYYVQNTVDGCTSGRTAVTVTISPRPDPPIAPSITVCAGSAPTLSASGSSGTYQWFSTAQGGSPLIVSPDYTTPALQASATYYVQTTVNGCTSERSPVTVTVNPIPPAPTAPGVRTCAGSVAQLNASGGDTFTWYAVPSRGAPLGTGATFTTPALNRNTTYYVEATTLGCTSARTAVTVTVQAIPDAPVAHPVTICSGASATLDVQNPAGTYYWYDVPTGGNPLSTASAYTTPALTANTTFYVENSTNGCSSARTAVVVTVNPPLVAPVASDVTICTGSAATLSASGSSGDYRWFDVPTGGTPIQVSPQLTTPALIQNKTYYVEAYTNNCVSQRVPVQVTVTTMPGMPAAANATICSGTTATLTASGSTGTYQWFDAATGGNLLFTGSTFSTPALSSDTFYYVQAVNGDCASNRRQVKVTARAISEPTFWYNSGTYCIDSNNQLPTIQSGLTGTFSASATGLVINPTTGEIDISASTPGFYQVIFTITAPCPMVSRRNVTITNSPDANFTFAASYCVGKQPHAAPVYPSGGSRGVFSASPSGLVFTSEGTINLEASQPGVYTITNTILSNGGTCGTTSATGTVTLYAVPEADAGDDFSAAPNTSVILSGTVQNHASYTWSGGAGTFANGNTLTPTYTPALNEASAQLILTATGLGPCAAVSDTINVNFDFTAPQVSGVTICPASTATLTASGPGTIEWYDSMIGGTLLTSGPTFVSAVLNNSRTYYVQRTQPGLTTARVAVTVTVAAALPAPVAPGTSVCAGSPAVLKATAGSGTIEWYDAPTGGTLLGTGGQFTTPALTAQTTTYYVQVVSGGCSSPRTAVVVTTKRTPVVTSASLEVICTGSGLNYLITADLAGTSFSWSRAQVNHISNTPVSNQTNARITETLVNTSLQPVDVTYVITPMLNGCSGPSFNYVVTVDPAPQVTSESSGAICNNSAPDYAITFNVPGVSFTWSRAAVPGISNRAIAGQGSEVIREVLTNTTTQPITVTYLVNGSFNGCAATPFSYSVVVSPSPTINSASSANICNETLNVYEIKSTMAGATYKWSRAAVAGISNAAVTDEAGSIISEKLINTTQSSITVTYRIFGEANGCVGPVFNYRVTVRPTRTVTVRSNAPVCHDGRIVLTATQITGASYSWTGPNGFTSTRQNPIILNATKINSGRYNLVVTLDGCSSPAGYADVLVLEPQTAVAGPDQTACINTPSVTVYGRVGGSAIGGNWTSSGNGTFLPRANSPTATYMPSAADIASGSVRLTLTSFGEFDCIPAVSSMTLTFAQMPVVQVGADREVCTHDREIALRGSVTVTNTGIWSSSGSGVFFPSATDLHAVYRPSNADLRKGKVTLILTATGSAYCGDVADGVEFTFIAPPTVNAGEDILLPLGRKITLSATVNYKDVTYEWFPNQHLSDNTVPNPVVTGVADQEYTLRVTDSRGCVTEDRVYVDVLMPIITNNTFTPNGDGVNDYWNIPELATYPLNTVMIFNRYGDKVFTSIGYQQPWDGNANGQPAPTGTYYYVIDTKVPGMTYSGSVTIIR